IQINNKHSEDVIRTLLKTSAELYYLVKNRDIDGFVKYFNTAGEFLGDYREKAQSESDWLIFQWLEKFNKNLQPEQKTCSRNGIGVLGPRNSYSHQAAEDIIKNLKLKNEICFMGNVDEIFQAVEDGEILAGIVPLENLISGTIRETADNLFKKNVKIRYEYKMAIHHCLAVLKKTKVIKSIYSHQQGFYQCSDFLKKNYKGVEMINKPSTSWSFDYIKKLHLYDAAVIASEKTALESGFEIITKNIENDKHNKTTFVVITRENTKFKTTKPNKVSIAFHFSRDSAGSLYGVLGEFATAKINLTKLESRPAEHGFGEYIFYIDFEGTLKSSEKILKAIKKKVAKLKILGEY
ncbi:MAG: prephenate dehydratase, partial [Candidatus Gracilibacteria bacterium]